ncbi:hypothetical protein Gobs01_02956 [Geodermatophilus obscurus DSM 43160]|uniref:Uncharacterized protein n=1 Tax=Geodermatophilus obscurus (strain ATCC 25078 / DSM 43160 / JCM 3152 / CCUG 61914 / KCC A-0152 / KCTC 9177 / NBRC 13315 / NRRL B-3577 / G-20) TaxID=526225 RepID=D2SC58_GEOOG|nr:hypothetical protein Gobs_1497 [Geodermatophilus obscurus DSM 43160]
MSSEMWFVGAAAVPPILAAITSYLAFRRKSRQRAQPKVLVVVDGKRVEFTPTREESDRLGSILAAHGPGNG